MSEDDIERMRGELLFLRKTVRILAAVQELSDQLPKPVIKQECPHVRGTVTQHCSLNFSLTDEERAAVQWFAHYGLPERHAATLRSLLERLK